MNNEKLFLGARKRVRETDAIIIGGGATGAGLARDLSRRGFECVLFERGDLATGATGRNHGRRHRGARYAVTDQVSAEECVKENSILRKIARHCVEETDGLFITLPEDDLEYQKNFIVACRAAGISAEALDPEFAKRLEPSANQTLIGAVKVPDGVVDPFRLTVANMLDAVSHGALCHTYCEVTGILVENAVATGVRVRDNLSREEYEVRAKVVINASGIWGGRVGAMAGVEVKMFPTRGSLLILGHRLNRLVINRCRKPADADILVPGDTVCLIGTTSIPIKFEEIDTTVSDREEVDILIREGALLCPEIETARKIRCYCGSRPLIADENDKTGRSTSRHIVLLDHETRDGLKGFVTISGGKLITYRLMAEMTTDLVCRKLGKNVPCDTHSVPLPGSHEPPDKILRKIAPLPPTIKAAIVHRHGDMATDIAAEGASATSLVCECELVSAAEVEHAVDTLAVRNMTDLRRRVRVGMGPCQGELCMSRAVGILADKGVCPPSGCPGELASFLVERWKGIHPLTWGETLRESEFIMWLYQGVCGIGPSDLEPGRVPGEAPGEAASTETPPGAPPG
ncbi:MAG: anaerobic glycerol-3-phosphate dehydrogenase subunit A [Deltaproteobacteria bacterium]|jgi:glycerol-3-phosphate dehydrogenase|nr:anaerobic glycerol-3-phosphate dehydrogenase subunit A [Deltaproteobacteria bacterium]